MKRQLKLENKIINYTLNTSKRARRVRLVVYCDGSFVVIKPARLSENVVEKFILKKADWVLSKLEYFKKFEFKAKTFKNNRKEYLASKAEALEFIKKRLDYFNEIYNFKFNKVSIKNQKTRWGSCSRKKNLNFNYKVLFLPSRVADYIIIHELCHLKELNHSQKFWNLVARAQPDYKNIKKELREGGVNN